MIGLAGSSIWLASVGALFPVIALALAGTVLAWLAGAGIALIVITLVWADVAVLRDVRRTFVPLPPHDAVGGVMMRRFKWVLGGEIAAFWIVDSVLSVMMRYNWMTPANILIIGVHFLPLAWVFRVPRYYALGLAFCAVDVVTLLLVPESAHVGRAQAWFFWTSLGCGPAAILCSIANTLEARADLAVARTARASA